MKKTILASAILLAGAANAAEIYNNDGSTISLNGSMRARLVLEASDDFKFQDSGSRFNIQATKEIEEGLKAFGKIQIKNNGADDSVGNDNNAYFNNAYVGFASDEMGTLKLGKFIGFNDDLVYNDFTYDGGLYDHQSDTSLGNGTNDQIQYTKTLGDAKVVVAMSDEDTYSIGGEYDAAGLTVGFAYDVANDRQKTATTLADNSAYIFAAKYNVDDLTVAFQYQATDISDKDFKGYGIGAEYAMGKARAYAMYDITDVDGNDKGSIATLGVDYVLAKGVKTYAEFYATDTGAKTGKAKNNKLNIGARVYF